MVMVAIMDMVTDMFTATVVMDTVTAPYMSRWLSCIALRSCLHSHVCSHRRPQQCGFSHHRLIRYVGEYILADIIGEGSFGQVRQAIHQSGKIVAIKEIKMKRVKKPKALEMVTHLE